MTTSAPYYAVIFTSKKVDGFSKEYAQVSEEMITLAKQQTGFIGLESARDEIGITVSYWESKEAIGQWKQNTEHIFAQMAGRNMWYDWYSVKIALIEREYEFKR